MVHRIPRRPISESSAVERRTIFLKPLGMGPTFRIGWSSVWNSYAVTEKSENRDMGRLSRLQTTPVVKQDEVNMTSAAGLSCDTNPGYCLNNGICIVNVHGRMECRCLSTSELWFRGDHCETAESIAKVSAIVGVCAAVVFVVVILLIIRIARLTVKVQKLENLSNSKRRTRTRAYVGCRFANPCNTDRRELPGLRMYFSPMSPALSEGYFASLGSPSHTSPSVRYSQLSTITKDGEARTLFMSNGTSNTETISSRTVVNNPKKSYSTTFQGSSDRPTNRIRFQTTGVVL